MRGTVVLALLLLGASFAGCFAEADVEPDEGTGDAALDLSLGEGEGLSAPVNQTERSLPKFRPGPQVAYRMAVGAGAQVVHLELLDGVNLTRVRSTAPANGAPAPSVWLLAMPLAKEASTADDCTGLADDVRTWHTGLVETRPFGFLPRGDWRLLIVSNHNASVLFATNGVNFGDPVTAPRPLPTNHTITRTVVSGEEQGPLPYRGGLDHEVRADLPILALFQVEWRTWARSFGSTTTLKASLDGAPCTAEQAQSNDGGLTRAWMALTVPPGVVAFEAAVEATVAVGRSLGGSVLTVTHPDGDPLTGQ